MAVADEITLVVVDSRVKTNWDMRLEKYRSLTLSTFSTTFEAKNEKLTAARELRFGENREGGRE